jgi:hypothetical protein
LLVVSVQIRMEAVSGDEFSLISCALHQQNRSEDRCLRNITEDGSDG